MSVVGGDPNTPAAPSIALVDSEGSSLRPNCCGRLLATTRPIGKCAAFPVGACAVLTACLLTSIGLAVHGVVSNDIARDVNPNVDGIEPRGTEVGNRDNTLKLLLFKQGGDANRDMFRQTGVCLGHAPNPDCNGFAQRRRLGGMGSNATAPPAAAAAAAMHTAGWRQLQDDGPATAGALCGGAGSDGCDHRQEVVFGARDGSNVLTAPLLRAICRWEEAVHAHPAFDAQCSRGGGGGCCFAPSVARTVAAMNNVSCAALTTPQVEASLQVLARCATSRDSPHPPPSGGAAQSELHDGYYCNAVRQPMTTASDALVLAVGDGPGFNGTWDPSSTGDSFCM